MIDQNKAIEVITEFLQDNNERVLLLRGYDNEAKVRVAFSCLNKEFDKGIIRTSSMKALPGLINRSFNKRLVPNAVKSTTTYKIARMTVNINSYVNHTSSNPGGNKDTFHLFYPVQTVLDKAEMYQSFLKELKDSDSRKIIIITTNEWSIKNWDIENHVDKVFFYSVENDNPDIMVNLRNNGAI